MTASIPEIMQSLNHLVSTRKVLYLGISDTPAWVVVKCNAYARQHGLRQFSVYQGKWSAAERDFERDIIPMCMDEGMSLAPWGALGGGYFKPKEQWGKDGGRNLPQHRAKDVEGVSEVLEKVAKRKGTVMTSVALAYVMHKSPYVFPICGGRKIEHLKGNIEVCHAAVHSLLLYVLHGNGSNEGYLHRGKDSTQGMSCRTSRLSGLSLT